MPMLPGRVEFPTLGYEPGFRSLATRNPNEFRLRGMGAVSLPFGFSFPTSVSELRSMELKNWALVGGVALLAFTMLKGGGGRRKRRGLF